jgi:hypothetical protein
VNDFLRLGAVIHGTPKIGKSWLGESCPGPVLIIDGEGSTDFLRRKTVTYWDGINTPPTVNKDGQPLGVDDAVVVKVLDWSPVLSVTDWLASGKHPFRSFVVDTLTEIQKKAKRAIDARPFTDQRQWGQLLDDMETTVRRWRDLLDHPVNPLFAVIVLVQTVETGKDDNTLQRPDVQGQLKRSLGSFFDIVGYMRPRYSADSPLPTREMVVAPYPGIEAGDRTDVLTSIHYPGGVIPNPDITELLRLINTKVAA